MGNHMNEHDFNQKLVCRRCGVLEEYGEGQTCYERRPQTAPSNTEEAWAAETFKLIIKSATLPDIKELIELLEDYIEEEYQKDIKV